MKNLLKEQCDEFGIDLSDKQIKQFTDYYDLLIEWNKKINLTRITEPEEVVTKHFADSLTLLKYCDIPKGARIIDVGTGAGFPGIPLKIARSDIELTLLDSLNKRLTFLKEVCRKTEISAEFVHSRAEDGAKNNEFREKFDISVSRAVARLNVLAEYCLPYVKPKGQFLAMKGPELNEELTEAQEAIKILGGKVGKVEEFSLKGSGRTIAVIDKVKTTPGKYPRHSSKIKAKPL